MSSDMHARRVLFAAPYRIQVKPCSVPAPAAHQLLVETRYSAISAGTEMLFYRGQVPSTMAVDATIDTLNQEQGVQYPLAYGYIAVGTVTAVGSKVDPSWIGRRIFAFHPHASHFLATPDILIPIPEGISWEQALLLPNMETAVNFVQDGAPLLGEQAVVLGQGVVGLLVTYLLAQFPLADLTTVDGLQLRRERSLALGARAAISPTASAEARDAEEPRADLVYELSGNPTALNSAIAWTRYSGRVVIGSWYGEKRAEIDLGGHFHRNRIQLISSQVSSVAPALQGRWEKCRRFAVAWSQLATLDVAPLITHRFAVDDAAAAYTLLDQGPAEALQVIFTY